MTRNVPRAKLPARLGAVLMLCLCLPLLLGGCPEFRDSVVNNISDATHSLILGGGEPGETLSTATQGIVGAILDLFFDQFRSGDNRT
jgi:hypothetical protein